MTDFYSILYANSNVSTGERFGIGLFMRIEDKVYFQYSVKKLSSLKGLYNDAAYALLKSYLSSLQQEIAKDTNSMLPSNINNLLSQDYISYLSKYANNLITFSPPTPFNIKDPSNIFKRLYNKYIFQEEHITTNKKIEIANFVQKKLYPQIKNRVNINLTLKSGTIENLLFDTNVGFIGKNGSIVSGQPIDFAKKNHHLENDLSHFISLIKAFDEEERYKHGKYYIIGEEPSKDLDKNHAIWRQVSKKNFINFVPKDEINQIKDYIFENDVRPFTLNNQISPK